MPQHFNDPIEVSVEFGSSVVPKKFIWHGREYVVKKVNLTYTRREGRVKFYYFTVSDEVNYFKLCFNSEDLTWALVEIYAE